MKRIIFSAMLVMSACMVFAARNYIYEMPVTEGCQAVRERLEDNRFELVKVDGNLRFFSDKINTKAVYRAIEGDTVEILLFQIAKEPNQRAAKRQFEEQLKETEKRFGKADEVSEEDGEKMYVWRTSNGYTLALMDEKGSISLTWALSSNYQ